MENVINSPGFFHISKKIIMLMDYSDKKYLPTIKSLRLVCNSWKNIIESNELCKFWHNILLRISPLNRDEEFKYSDLIYGICHPAFAKNDGKSYQWKVTHFILLYISNIYSKQSWPSVDKNIWHNSNNFEKIVKYQTLKPTTIEIFFLFCDGSPELLALIPNTIVLDNKRLLVLAMYNFCQKGTVKYLLRYNFAAIGVASRTLIMQLSWRIMNCQFNYPKLQTVKENLTKVLSVFIELFPDVIAECISQVDYKYIQTKFEHRTDMIPNGTCGSPCQLVPKELVDFIEMNNPFLMELYNPLLTALHYDKDHQLNNMINLFATVLRKIRYLQEIKSHVLESMNFYAALNGYCEIAEFVAEIVGPNRYAELSIDFMQNCLCWIDENVLKFMAFKIDQDDWQKITKSEDSSLHVAVKKKNWQFIQNFAPFSTTIFEKGKDGRNVLLSSLKPSFSFSQARALYKLLYYGFFPEQLENIKSPELLEKVHQLAGLHGFVQIITWVAEDLGHGNVEKAFDILTKNTDMFNNDVLSKAAKSEIVKEKIGHVLTLLVHPLKNIKYPEVLKDESLQSVHKCAALIGFIEIVEIITEKLGKDYVDLAIEIMKENTDWIHENILRFIGSEIDQNDVKTIQKSKVSSLLNAAKERHLQFIINFAPFSTTAHEKDKIGKTALLLVLDLNNLSSTDQKLQEKAAKILMETMEKSQLQRTQQSHFEKLENTTETDSDFCFEDSDHDGSGDLYESESD